jgi:hypothetical protein
MVISRAEMAKLFRLSGKVAAEARFCPARRESTAQFSQSCGVQNPRHIDNQSAGTHYVAVTAFGANGS